MPGMDQAPGAYFRLLFDSFSERLPLDAAEFPDSLGPVRLSASQHWSASGTGEDLKISLWSDMLCTVLCIIKMVFFQGTTMTHGAKYIYIHKFGIKDPSSHSKSAFLHDHVWECSCCSHECTAEQKCSPSPALPTLKEEGWDFQGGW